MRWARRGCNPRRSYYKIEQMPQFDRYIPFSSYSDENDAPATTAARTTAHQFGLNLPETPGGGKV